MMDQAKIDKILAPVGEQENQQREEAVRAKFWRVTKKAARHIPFMEDVVAAYYCALDSTTPLRVRGTLFAALFYFVLPFDIIPDFLALIGFTDDIAVLAAAIAAVHRHITPAHREAAHRALHDL